MGPRPPLSIERVMSENLESTWCSQTWNIHLPPVSPNLEAKWLTVFMVWSPSVLSHSALAWDDFTLSPHSPAWLRLSRPQIFLAWQFLGQWLHHLLLVEESTQDGKKWQETWTGLTAQCPFSPEPLLMCGTCVEDKSLGNTWLILTKTLAQGPGKVLSHVISFFKSWLVVVQGLYM